MIDSDQISTGMIKTKINLKNVEKAPKKQKTRRQKHVVPKLISRAKFLRILLLDIITCNVYIFTIILQGVHLSRDNSTWIYGGEMIAILWMPSLLIIPHELYYKTQLCQFKTTGSKVFSVMIGFLLFPILPSLLYGNQLTRNKDMLYLKRLDKMQNIRLFLQSSLYLILLVFLIMRGELFQDEDSCVIDDLGRSFCIFSPAIISAVLSIFILLRATTNIYLAREKTENTFDTIEKNILYLPYLINMVVFRIGSYAYMFNYIDYWGAVPVAGIILINMLSHVYTSVQNHEKQYH